MSDYFLCAPLLAAPPVHRAAYSDRTAWIMAELSRLCYERLPCETPLNEHVASLISAIRTGEYGHELDTLVHTVRSGNVSLDSSAVNLTDELTKAKFTLLESFAIEGTEAMLVRMSTEQPNGDMLVLAFRGTQPNIRDVLTDIKANLVPAPGGGRVHKGFLDAYTKVEAPIREALTRHDEGLPLYFTGHSLGGALALIATRYLGGDSTGATYTFGAPRAADDHFYCRVKTPIYRVVNAADGVARVPFGYGLNIVLGGLRLLPFSIMHTVSEKVRALFGEYTHEGVLVFMNDVPNVPDANGIAYRDLWVKTSPNYLQRAHIVLSRLATTRTRAAAQDHYIATYCAKLLAHAMRRAD